MTRLATRIAKLEPAKGAVGTQHQISQLSDEQLNQYIQECTLKALQRFGIDTAGMRFDAAAAALRARLSEQKTANELERHINRRLVQVLAEVASECD